MPAIRPLSVTIFLLLNLMYLGHWRVEAQDASNAPGRPPDAVTYEGILRMLRQGEGEEAILKILRDSPTTFVLAPSQSRALEKAGATPRLLKEMQGVHNPVSTGSDISDFAIVLDCSGSMKEKTSDGITKMEAAKRVVTRFIQDIPDGKRLAFIVFGTTPTRTNEESCQDIKVVQSLEPLDARVRGQLVQFIDRIQPYGSTPLGQSLRMAGLQLARKQGMCQLVLITDGMDTCNGDPAKVAEELNRDLQLPHGLDVVGLGVSPKEKRSLQEIAAKGKGHFYDARNASELDEAMVRMGRDAREQARLAAEKARAIADRAEAEARARRQAEEDRLAKLHAEDNARRQAEENLLAMKAADARRKAEAEEARTIAEANRLRLEEEKRIKLAEYTDDPFVAVLIEHLKDEDARVRAKAAFVLEKMGRRASARAAIPALTRIIVENRDGRDIDWGYNKTAALKALKALAPEKVKATLVRAAESTESGVKQWAIEKLTERDR